MPKPALKSMTGYAQARADRNGWAVRVSVRSVNHRFLDLHVRLPEGFEAFEPDIRQLVRRYVCRGHVDVTLRIEPAGSAAVLVNREVAAAYLEAAEELRQHLAGKSELDVAAVLRLPGVISAAALPEGGDSESLRAELQACLEEALERLDAMREFEGRLLAEEMAKRLGQIAEHATRIEFLAEGLQPAYARRLELRLKELLGSVQLDPARLAQEAALLAERADVSEELTRLRSHLRQIEKLLESPGEVGKKLDFLLQEMQREANTILSKTPGFEADGLTLTDLALEVKSEIEKLREQAQNLE